MKKRRILFIGLLLLLVSCTPGDIPDEVVQNPDEEVEQDEVSIVPSYRLSDKNYKMAIERKAGKAEWKPSQARGVIVNQVANRLDIDEMEEGLRRHSTDYFDPEEFYFEEGQYLSSETVYKWLGRKLSKKQLEEELQKEIERRKKAEMTVNDQVIDNIKKDLQIGLNPSIKSLDGLNEEEIKQEHEENPRYVSHILEQNFLKRVDDNIVELAGVSIGIAMKSSYRYQTETGGPDFYREISKKEMLDEGKEIAQAILERIRHIEELQDVPVMIAIYREEAQTSLVPGNYIAKTFVEGSGTMTDEWETIDEEYVLFPSEHAKEMYYDIHDILEAFGQEIVDYFPNYVGYIGQGFYADGQLRKLTIEIPIEFHGSSEVIGFTQYTYGLIKSSFTGDYDLEVKIASNKKVESVIFREAGDDPLVHIFH